MGDVATRAGRHFLVFLFPEPFAVDRRIVLGDLIDAQRRIISPHEIWVRVAFAADFDDLNSRGLADETFFLVHRLQAHDIRITAMTGDTSETFGCVNIGFVQFGRFGQILNTKRQMAGNAVVGLWLGGPYCSL